MGVRDRMKADLTRALAQRDAEQAVALRTALAAIDNAEALPADDVARLRAAGVTEAPRRALAEDEIRAVVQGECDACRAASEEYASLGRGDDAARLARSAQVLASYLAD